MSTFKERRYAVKARRSDDELWSAWTETNSKEEAIRHKGVIESLGWQARIVDRADTDD